MKSNTIPPTPSNLRFLLDLGDGTRCTAKIALAHLAALPAQSLPAVIRFEWQGCPRNKHWLDYFTWMKSVWQHLADIAQDSVVLVFTPPAADSFFIVFQPDAPSQTTALPRVP